EDDEELALLEAHVRVGPDRDDVGSESLLLDNRKRRTVVRPGLRKRSQPQSRQAGHDDQSAAHVSFPETSRASPSAAPAATTPRPITAHAGRPTAGTLATPPASDPDVPAAQPRSTNRPDRASASPARSGRPGRVASR